MRAAQHKITNNLTNTQVSSTRKIVSMGILVALSVLLMVLIQIPLFTDFMMYDASDVPMLIGAFWLGPIPGIVMSGMKAMIYLFIKGISGPIGALANFVATASFVGTASYWYFRHRNLKGAVTGMILGTIVMTIIMTGFNPFLLRIWGIPEDAIMPTILTVTIPFNLTRGTLSILLTLPVYKKVKNIMANI